MMSYYLTLRLQRKPDQAVGLVCHKQRDIQNVPVQFQVIQRKTDAQLYLVRKQFLELFQAAAGCVGRGFYLHRENIVAALYEKIYLIGRVGLRPVAGRHLKLRDQRLQHKIFRQCTLKFGKQAIAITKV